MDVLPDLQEAAHRREMIKENCAEKGERTNTWNIEVSLIF